MKKRSELIIAILIMAIGFAAISTTLVINGNTKVGENTEDFSVIFTAATIDGTDVYNDVISEDKKTITFETNDLKTLNQTSVLNYEVTNNSSNYDAEVTVNCKIKDDAEAKYTSIKNELEENATVVKAKETLNGTLTVNLEKVATEEVKEEYVCELTFNAVERDELGKGIPDPVSFATDSWETIQNAVQTGNTDVYNVGDTKTIELTNFGTHTLRIANKTECTNGETSETACGFIVEFADIIENHSMNNSDTNTGGWKNSELRTYLNSTIYESIPSDIQNVISETKVVSSYKTTTFLIVESSDKLYLFTSKEIFGEAKGDVLTDQTRQLDYYKNNGVTLNDGKFAIKQYNGANSSMWLRSSNGTLVFTALDSGGNWNNFEASTKVGISPAFRIA